MLEETGGVGLPQPTAELHALAAKVTNLATESVAARAYVPPSPLAGRAGLRVDEFKKPVPHGRRYRGKVGNEHPLTVEFLDPAEHAVATPHFAGRCDVIYKE